MVNYDFAVVSGQTVTFDSTSDQLSILTSSATSVTLEQIGTDLRVTVAGQGSVTLANTVLDDLVPSSIFFLDSTVVVTGDLTVDDTAGGGDNVLDFTSDPLLVAALGRNNQILGLAGNDTIIAGNGDNVIYGGSGNASTVDGGDDIRIGSGTNTVFGNAGDDDVTFTAVTAAGKQVQFSGGLGNDSFTSVGALGVQSVHGGAGNDMLSLTASTASHIIYGGSGNDSIDATGSTGGLIIYGGNGDADATDGGDAITLGGGSANVFTNAGADAVTATVGAGKLVNLFLGVGNDTVTSDNSSGAYYIAGGLGSDKIDLALFTGIATVYGGNNADTPTDTGDTITGGTGGNILIYGNGGADLINVFPSTGTLTDIYGGAGNDTVVAAVQNSGSTLNISGNLGNDVFRLDFSGASTSVLIRDFGNGTDAVQTTLFGGVATAAGLTITRTASQTVIANGAAEQITFSNYTGNFNGTSFALSDGSLLVTNFDSMTAASLAGGANNDQLIAGAAGDTLTAGAGNDKLTGGAGNDTFSISIVEFNALDTVAGGGGTNTLLFSAAGAPLNDGSFSHISNVQTLKFSGGNFAADPVVLGTLASSVGITLVDANSLTGGNGVDVTLVSMSHAVQFIGGAGADVVRGTTFGDTLRGAGGDDVITGDIGADRLTGGQGNNIFSYDALQLFINQEGNDSITDFDAGDSVSSVDQLQFDADAMHYNLGNGDTVVSGAVISSVTPAGAPGTELVILNTVGIATADISSQLNTINSLITPGVGVIDILFDTTKGHAVVYYDSNGNTAGGHILLANLTGITNLADMGDFDFSDIVLI